MTVRIADPRPAYCSACLGQLPGSRFVDFDAAHDGGAFVDADTKAYIEGQDDLFLCEACVKLAAEVLGLKPELHGRQLREIDRLRAAADHWKERSQRLAGELSEALADAPEKNPRSSSRRKVTV